MGWPVSYPRKAYLLFVSHAKKYLPSTTSPYFGHTNTSKTIFPISRSVSCGTGPPGPVPRSAARLSGGASPPRPRRRLCGCGRQRRGTALRKPGAHCSRWPSERRGGRRAGFGGLAVPRRWYSVVPCRPVDLLVFHLWSIFSHGPKRLTFWFQVLWAIQGMLENSERVSLGFCPFVWDLWAAFPGTLQE